MALRAKDVGGEFFTPREYQVELFEHSIDNDSIILLPTGTGKTYIAVMLIKHMTQYLGPHKKTAVFIVNKIPILEQQFIYINNCTSLNVGKWHNKDVTSHKDAFIEFVQNNDVILITSEHFLNGLNHALIKAGDFALIVMDECHHCLGDGHHYRKIMNIIKNYKKESKNGMPRFLGLTACALNGKVLPENLSRTLNHLEIAIGAKVITSSTYLQNAKYANRPKECVFYCKDNNNDNINLTPLLQFDNYCSILGDFTEGLDVDPRSMIRLNIRRVLNVLEDCGIYCSYQVAKSSCRIFQKAMEQDHLPENQFIALSAAYYTFQTFCVPLNEMIGKCSTYDEISPYLSDRVVVILQILESFYRRQTNNQQPMSALIFVEKRATAISLCLLFRHLAKSTPKFNFIKPDYAIGNTSGGERIEDDENRGMDKRFHEAVANFRNGTTNVMVATQILEEGIDIRTCNLVIRANIPSTFTSYIHSRGRARLAPSMFALIVSESEQTDMLYNLNIFKRNERLLIERMYALRNTVPERADQYLDLHPDDLVPPYVTPSGAKVSLSEAISVVNRYCARLPSDVFTRLAVKIRTHRVEGGYFSELLFPINSPIKKVIKGKVCPTIKLAEKMVAFEACKKLHESNELDDNLLPLTKDKVASMLELSEEFGDFATNVPRETGSAKKRRMYPRRVATALNKVLPLPDQPFFVYLIELNLVEPIPEQSNPKKRRIINPKDTPHIFGLCTKSKLPKIPSFPVYQRQGKILANIKLHSKQFSLTESELELVKIFHSYIFEEILGLKNEMHFQPEIASFSTLLIPLKRTNEDFIVDFDILKETVKGFPPRPTDDERMKFEYNPERYKEAVVKPWYRPNERDAYYIGEIQTGYKPSSPFADPKFETFNEYFAEKYGLEVYNQDQHLLDVDNTSNRMNLLLPRITQQRAIRRANDHSQKQYMIPELVSIHPMPEPLWIMVIELPTILFRMNCLLLADEFRSKVASAALSIESEPNENFTWSELQYPIPANNILSVKNLEQLKRVNAEDNAEDELKKTKIEEKQQSSDEAAAMDFQIGVWDPSLGDKYRDLPLNTPEETEVQKPPQVPVEDDLSSDDEQWSQVNIDVVDFGRENVYPASTNLEMDDFPELGWDDVNIPEAQAASQAQIAISSTDGINISSLLHDIESITPGQPVRRTRLQAKDLGVNAVDMMDENDKIAKAFKRGVNKDEEDTLNIYMDKLPQEIITENDLKFVQVDKEQMLDQDKAVSTPEKPNIDFFNKKSISERISVPEFPEFMESWFLHDKTHANPYGVPPTLLLQALTTSSASDGFNLERLETIGDSFLKLSVTNYLYSYLPHQHEGNLSYIRSREVSNANLFQLGKTKGIPCLMECVKFEPSVNWLPPGYGTIGSTFDTQMMEADEEENTDEANGWGVRNENEVKSIDGVETLYLNESKGDDLLPYSYNYLSQQYISDKAIADCVEALIGSHLIALGPSKTLDFMKWLGIKVLTEKPELKPPVEVLAESYLESEETLNTVTLQRSVLEIYNNTRFEKLEKKIGYTFRDRSFLVQAFTHASYTYNRVTGCYQRLEFLGDAVLDYLITRYLYEHRTIYSPGVLTDLRSALVNNVIFASLAVKYEMQQYLLVTAPPLISMIERFVELHKQKGEVNFNDDMFMVTEDEVIEGAEEDVEVPKALGDIFESLAGAIYLDCDMDLKVVWRIFYDIMKDTIERCCRNPPQSPIRELFEMKSHKVRFTKVERLIEKSGARVTVEIDNGKFSFSGVGRSYRIAKTTAAKGALRYLRRLDANKEQDHLLQQQQQQQNNLL